MVKFLPLNDAFSEPYPFSTFLSLEAVRKVKLTLRRRPPVFPPPRRKGPSEGGKILNESEEISGWRFNNDSLKRASIEKSREREKEHFQR